MSNPLVFSRVLADSCSSRARFDSAKTIRLLRGGLRARSRRPFLKQSPLCSLLGKLHEGRYLFSISALNRCLWQHECAMSATETDDRRDRKRFVDEIHE